MTDLQRIMILTFIQNALEHRILSDEEVDRLLITTDAELRKIGGDYEISVYLTEMANELYEGLFKREEA